MPSPAPSAVATAPLLFRRATLADTESIVGLVQSAYRGDGAKVGWTTETDLLDGQRTDVDAVRDLLVRPSSQVVLAESLGELLACVHLERHARDCHLGMFSVDPSRQARGIGRTVMAEAERVARDEWGCLRMTMTVIDVRVELLSYYARRGYTPTGEHRPFPYGDPRFGIPRRPDLRFAVLAKELAAV
jgi:GNAT superfamily N-acetyltransferase